MKTKRKTPKKNLGGILGAVGSFMGAPAMGAMGAAPVGGPAMGMLSPLLNPILSAYGQKFANKINPGGAPADELPKAYGGMKVKKAKNGMRGPGEYDPKKDGRHQRDMDRFMSGLQKYMQDSYDAEHKQSKKQVREQRKQGKETVYYPAPQPEVRHLLEGLESGGLNFEDAVKKGKGRRGRQQAAAIAAQILLPMFLKGKVMQTEAERATGNRPSFFDALRMRNR